MVIYYILNFSIYKNVQKWYIIVMRKYLTKNFLIVGLYAISALLLEVFLFATLNFGIMPKYVLFDLAFISLFCGVLLMLPGTITKTVAVSLLLLAQVILNIVNSVLYAASGEVFYFELLLQLAAGVQAFSVSFINFFFVGTVIAFFVLDIILLIQINKIHIPNKYPFKQRAIFFICAIFALETFAGTTFIGQQNALAKSSATDDFYLLESDKNLYDTQFSKNGSFKKFGSFAFYTQNIVLAFGKNTINTTEKDDVAEQVSKNVAISTPMTNVSQGNNLITILLESLDYFAIDPVFTPNLYKLFYQDGLLLSNFYSENRTNISEGLVLMGNYSQTNPLIYGRDTALSAINNGVIDYTLPQLFGNEGYSTTYIHANTGNFYRRSETFGENGIGFDELIFREDMTRFSDYGSATFDDWGNFPTDASVIYTYPEYFSNTGESFYTNFSLVSMHGPYKESQKLKPLYDELLANESNYNAMWNYLIESGFTKPTDSKLIEKFNWYKAGAMIVDEAIEILFDELEENGLLETTTIVMFADHPAHYDNLSYYLKGVNPSSSLAYAQTKIYNIPCVIYDQKLCAELNEVSSYGDDKLIDGEWVRQTGYNYTNFCSSMNLTTTILDLFGIEYYENLYSGCSIFDEDIDNTVFQSFLGSNGYFNNRIYFEDEVLWTAPGVTKEEIEKFKQNCLTFLQRQTYIETLYNNPEIFNLIESGTYV